ncbi:penicillin-binding protein activator LpoB [Rheinheimera pleomorphica]|uniref:penicillin-binding protein activator LpoB n=1 Tax=Rheinheimera pleomorphica TaxID=2703963 RepID=UPI00142161C5|nr:penicillin-binding protein activator LpoB [Rheinheimera pleomorphica]
MKKLMLMALLLLTGCASQMSSESPQLDFGQVVYIMPFTNQSTSPLAQAQAEQLLASVLADAGVKVEIYPKAALSDLQASIEPEQRQRLAQQWLSTKTQGYVMYGMVQEWQYKYGLDGEPAVGVTLQLTDMQSRELWRGSAARSGWGRESLSHLAIKTFTDLSNELDWN